MRKENKYNKLNKNIEFFQDLKCWQVAREVRIETAKFIKSLPKDGFVSYLKPCAGKNVINEAQEVYGNHPNQNNDQSVNEQRTTIKS